MNMRKRKVAEKEFSRFCELKICRVASRVLKLPLGQGIRLCNKIHWLTL